MLTSQDCMRKYGNPKGGECRKHYTNLVLPEEYQFGNFPDKIYCNLDMIDPLINAFINLKSCGADKEVKTFDGCYNVRVKRGGTSYSLHSWGIAIDINAGENPFQAKTRNFKFSKEFIDCFKDAGFDWGGDWKSVFDPMHFQLARI